MLKKIDKRCWAFCSMNGFDIVEQYEGPVRIASVLACTVA
jgi:hypothetical protein